MSSSSSSSAAPVKRPVVEFGAGFKGLPTILLRQPCGYSAEVIVPLAQVISWKNERGEELLFVSKKAVIKSGCQIRGGILIGCPWFYRNGSIMQPGLWTIDVSSRSSISAEKASVDLLTGFPHYVQHEFRLRVILESNGDLRMISTIKNIDPDGQTYVFHMSFPVYFPVSDISEVQIEGLKTGIYMDYVQDGEFTEKADAITFISEVDRDYGEIPHMTITKVIDHQRGRTYSICRYVGLPDIVVWNPWDEKAKEIDDLDDKEYKEMVCVGAAAVKKYNMLKPGDVWVGNYSLSIHPVDPLKSHIVDAIFNQAGAVDASAEHLLPSSSPRSFAGTGRLLSEDVSSTTTPQHHPQVVNHIITFWRNGFTVGDGPYRRLDDPLNAPFLESIKKCECPEELVPADTSTQVRISLMKKDQDYKEPKKRDTSFCGVSRPLGSSSDDVMPETVPTALATAYQGLVVDETQSTTSIQLRLADGTRMASRFNNNHTIRDIRGFIDASRPGGQRTYQLQSMGFPPKKLDDLDQTIDEAGIANSVVIQKL